MFRSQVSARKLPRLVSTNLIAIFPSLNMAQHNALLRPKPAAGLPELVSTNLSARFPPLNMAQHNALLRAATLTATFAAGRRRGRGSRGTGSSNASDAASPCVYFSLPVRRHHEGLRAFQFLLARFPRSCATSSLFFGCHGSTPIGKPMHWYRNLPPEFFLLMSLSLTGQH